MYWTAFVLLVLIYAFTKWIMKTQTGRIWQATRENALRVEVLGFNVYVYRLLAAGVASTLASVCGVAYAIVMGGADPSITVILFSLSLILMVVLGGRGLIWGAVIGGVLYSYLDLRMPALSGSQAIADLPAAARIPLEQPQFILGALFVVVIIFLPGGIADGLRRLGDRLSTRQARDPVHQ